MIQIWDSVKGEWVDKFSAPEKEIERIVQVLEAGGLRVIVVGDGFMPIKPSSIEQNIIQALIEAE